MTQTPSYWHSLSLTGEISDYQHAWWFPQHPRCHCASHTIRWNYITASASHYFKERKPDFMSCRDGVRVNRPGCVQCNKAAEMALPGQFTNLSARTKSWQTTTVLTRIKIIIFAKFRNHLEINTRCSCNLFVSGHMSELQDPFFKIAVINYPSFYVFKPHWC